MTQLNEHELPMLLAQRLPDDPSRVRAWCCWCRRFHYHGAGEGHRVAHCGEGSPFRDGGYLLKLQQEGGA